MNDNQVIQKWRDKREGIKQDTCTRAKPECMGMAVYGRELGKDACTCPKITDIDYTDPAAWDEALYQEIVERGLSYAVSDNILGITNSRNVQESHIVWNVFAATPAQKAAALARAIKETEGK